MITQITVLHFGVVQGYHKTRSPNPLLCLIYACKSWVLKPSTNQARIIPVILNALLYSTPKGSLLPKSKSNELDNEVGTNMSERYTVKLPQTRTHPLINPQLSQLRLYKQRGEVRYGRKRLPRTLSLVESDLFHLNFQTLFVFALRNVDDLGHLKTRPA